MVRRRGKVALFNIERSEWAARRRVWSGRRLTGDRCEEFSWPTSTAALARSNSSSRDWCLDRRALPHRCSLLRRACHAHTQAHRWFCNVCIYASAESRYTFFNLHSLSLSLTQTLKWRTHSAGGGGQAGRERVQGQLSLFSQAWLNIPASTKPLACLGRPAESLPSASRPVPHLPAALLILPLSISWRLSHSTPRSMQSVLHCVDRILILACVQKAQRASRQFYDSGVK